MKDFGYFGKGTDGYVHYMQAFNESNKGGGGHGPKKNSGCLTVLLAVVGIPAAIVTLINLIKI